MPYIIVVNGTDTGIVYNERKLANTAFQRAINNPETNWATIVRSVRKDCQVVQFYSRPNILDVS